VANLINSPWIISKMTSTLWSKRVFAGFWEKLLGHSRPCVT